MPNYANRKPGRLLKNKTPGVRALERAVERVGAESGTSAKPAPRKERTDARFKQLLSEFDRSINELRRLSRPPQNERRASKAPPAQAVRTAQRLPVSPTSARGTRSPLPAGQVRERVSPRVLPHATRADKEAVRQLTTEVRALRPRVPHAVRVAEAKRALSYVHAAESTRRAPAVSSAVALRRAPAASGESVVGERKALNTGHAAPVAPRSEQRVREPQSVRGEQREPAAVEAINRHELTVRNLESARRETDRQLSALGVAAVGHRSAGPSRATHNVRVPVKAAAAIRSSREVPGQVRTSSQRVESDRVAASSQREVPRHGSEPGRGMRVTPGPTVEPEARQALVRALSTNEAPHLAHATTVEKEKLRRESRLRTRETTRSEDRTSSERLVEREQRTADLPAASFHSRSLGKITSPATARTAKEPEKDRHRGGGTRREVTGKLTITSTNGQSLGKADLQLDMG